MALDTYTGLKASIADTLDRDDLTDQIDDFIDLAETFHKRQIRIVEMLTRIPMTIDARYLALPEGFLQAQILRILTNEAGQEIRHNVLQEVNIHQLTAMRKKLKTIPIAFNNHGNEIEFDAEPDQAYGGEMLYYKEFIPLSDANPDNALLTRSPDAYLYGALIASAPFLMHDERIAIWGDLYAASVRGMTAQDQRARYTGPVSSRVDGTTP